MTGTVEDSLCLGQPVVAMMAEHRTKVVNLVTQSPQKLFKKLSMELGVSQTLSGYAAAPAFAIITTAG